MAYRTKSGKVLRNPAEKAVRFSRQLKNGKVTETGKRLTPSQKAFRKGYLQARRDNANAFKSKKKRFYR